MIKKDKVVALTYVLKNKQDEVLDEATKEDLFYYLHGRGQIVPGLENALDGLKIGDKKDITVTPEQGYGTPAEDLKVVVSRSKFPADTEVEVGMQFLAETTEGVKHPFTIVKLEGDKVHMDGNHPLAGETLYFAVEVFEVRDATKHELEHGHAHPPGSSHE